MVPIPSGATTNGPDERPRTGSFPQHAATRPLLSHNAIWARRTLRVASICGWLLVGVAVPARLARAESQMLADAPAPPASAPVPALPAAKQLGQTPAAVAPMPILAPSVTKQVVQDPMRMPAVAPRAALPRAAKPAVEIPLPQTLARVLGRRTFASSRLSVQVVRLDTQEVLFARSPHALLVPASNVKIVTTLAALDALTPDFQFPTELYGALDGNGVMQGGLGIKGYGDPYLTPERMWYLASRLRMLGLTRLAGDLIVDDSFFDPNDRMALGWQEDRTSRAYMAPAGALSAGFNALMVHVVPAAMPGQPATVMLDPVQAYAQLRGEIQTRDHVRGHIDIDVVPDGQISVVKIRGDIDRFGGPRAFWRRIDNPPQFAGALLANALAAHGIGVDGKIKTDAADKAGPLWFTSVSPRLGELLVPLNKYSNNFMASQLALVLGAYRHGAPATWKKAHTALSRFLADKLDMAPGQYSINNASGLHTVNAMSASQLVRLLRFAHGQARYGIEFQNSLATAAASGTLVDRMHDSAAARVVRAKTGTLAQASSLSGYAHSANGVPLAFSFLCNGYRHIEDVWHAQDDFAAALASATLPCGSAKSCGTSKH